MLGLLVYTGIDHGECLPNTPPAGSVRGRGRRWTPYVGPCQNRDSDVRPSTGSRSRRPLFFGMPLLLRSNELPATTERQVVALVVGAYALRLALSFIVTDLPIFSYGARGDAAFYEENAEIIARLWQHESVFYVDMETLPDIGRTTLPCNILRWSFT